LTNQPRFGSLAEEHGHQIDNDLVQDTRVEALPDDVGHTDADDAIAGDRCGPRHTRSTPSLTNLNGASSRDQPSATSALWVTTKTGTLRDLTQWATPAQRLPEITESGRRHLSSLSDARSPVMCRSTEKRWPHMNTRDGARSRRPANRLVRCDWRLTWPSRVGVAV